MTARTTAQVLLVCEGDYNHRGGAYGPFLYAGHARLHARTLGPGVYRLLRWREPPIWPTRVERDADTVDLFEVVNGMEIVPLMASPSPDWWRRLGLPEGGVL
jgi:hypothetical protein